MVGPGPVLISTSPLTPATGDSVFQVRGSGGHPTPGPAVVDEDARLCPAPGLASRGGWLTGDPTLPWVAARLCGESRPPHLGLRG